MTNIKITQEAREAADRFLNGNDGGLSNDLATAMQALINQTVERCALEFEERFSMSGGHGRSYHGPRTLTAANGRFIATAIRTLKGN